MLSMRRKAAHGERAGVRSGVDAKAGLNVLCGAVSAECAQAGRHSQSAAQRVVSNVLAAVLLLPLASCSLIAPVVRCVPDSLYMPCKVEK